jgi:hypothetical protein
MSAKGAGMLLLVLFLLFGVFWQPIMDGIKGWRTDNLTQTFLVTTLVGQTSANVTLSQDLYQANSSSIISIQSSEPGDLEVATAYDEDTKTLTLGGLQANTTRTIAINYLGEVTNTVLRVVGPWLAVLIPGGIIALVWLGNRKR